MRVRRSDHIGFSVASLDDAVRFWVDALGARLVRRSEMAGDFLRQVTGAEDAQITTTIVELTGQTIELLEYRGVESPHTRARPFDAGAAHLALMVDDLDAALKLVAGYGWRAQGVPQTIPAGPRAGTRVMYVVGPDGAAIEFMQSPSAVG